jgi:putative transposase
MGSNMAENHPIAFRFALQAKERGATLIHVDPRFTRTSALCDIYAPLRPGSDIAFLVLNKMPKSLHTKAKRALQEIWMAETKKDAVKALEAPVQARGRLFVETYQVKYKRATDCLIKDRAALLAFYDFPAEHWKHLRTTNPIESTFATVRHRTIRSKGCLSNKTALAMVFKLAEGAQKSWRRIDGHNQLPKLIQGVKFADAIEVIGNSAVPQAQAAA